MKNIVLFGHGIGVKLVIESLLKNSHLGFKVNAVFTHPYHEHIHDLNMMEKRKIIYGDYSYNVFNVNIDYGIQIHETKDINDTEILSKLIELNPEYIISIGCRNIIKKPLIDRFKNKILNIHTTPLPRYRGAASDTFMILNNEWGKELFGCIHFIDEKIDTGDIVAKINYKIKDRSYPIDIFKNRMDIYNNILIEGLSKLLDNKFIPLKQDNINSTTFPRLYTPTDGKIDFQKYKFNEIIRFIYAFGYPHEGAFCYFNDIKVHILEADFFQDENFHPFCNGLIFSKNLKGEYKVVINGGYMLIKVIEINEVKKIQSKIFKLGKFLK